MATRAMNSNAAVAIGVVVLLLVALSRRDGRRGNARAFPFWRLGAAKEKSDSGGADALKRSFPAASRQTDARICPINDFDE